MYQAVMDKAERKAHRDITAPRLDKPLAQGERAYRSDRYRTGRWSPLALFDWPLRVLLLVFPTAGAGIVARDAGRTFLSALRESWDEAPEDPMSSEERQRLERVIYRMLAWSRFASWFAVVYGGCWFARSMLAHGWGIYAAAYGVYLAAALYNLPYVYALRARLTGLVRQVHGPLHASHPERWAFAETAAAGERVTS